MKPTYETIKNYDLFFVVLDTLNLANAKIDTDILSPTFLQLIDININGHKLDNRFIAISHAIDTLYQDERTDMIPYAPPSVFYNMIDLLKDYDKAIQGLDALLYKSGCFIYQFPSKSKISGATYDAIKTSNYILEQKSNGSVISIQKDADIKDFPLSNINGLIEAVNKLEDAITKALNDTPASILFDRQLSNGFSNGDKDKETEIQIVNTFRQNKIKPLYELTDYYVMLKAWNEDFINEIKEKYTDLSKYSNIQLFKKWQDDFVFEFGNLYPEPESITIENNSKKLDNLLKLQQLGANASDIEAELNEDRIFKNDIDLDGQPQQFDNDNENNQIDYNLYKSIFGKSKKLTKYIDSNINVMIDEEPPEGHEWKTLKNGEHVLINSASGEIVSGIGGAKPQPKKSNSNNKKGLDNSDNNNILNNRKGNNTINKQKEGDEDGRQQQKQQSTSEERRELKRQAFAKIRNDTGSNGQRTFIRRGSVWGLNEQYKEILSKADIPTFNVRQLEKGNIKSAQQFSNTIKNIKKELGDKGASVSIYSEEDYKDMDLYLSEDGQSGIAVKPNGDIVSVFAGDNAPRGSGYTLMLLAIQNGGRQLDCFDTHLPEYYNTIGFEPVAKMKWNDEYIPEGWNKENFKDYNNGEPDVVFMVYDPEGKLEKKKEEYKARGEEWKPIEVYDYDDGETFQHIHKWRSPAEREAIYNNMLEKYKNAKTSEELKKTVFDNDAPLDDFNRLFNDLNSLNKEQKQGIKDEYDKRMLELLKEEDPEQYKAHKKYLEQKAKEKAKKEKEKNKATSPQKRTSNKITITNKSKDGLDKAEGKINDILKSNANKVKEEVKKETKADARTYIDNAIQTPFINDLLILADAKREFDESKIKRDKDGRFAKKNESGDGNNDTDNKNSNGNKDTDNKGTDDKSNTVKTVDEYNKDIAEKYNNIINNNKTVSDFREFVEKNKERISKEQSNIIHNIMTDFLKDIANDKELQNKIKDFTDDELMTFAIYKKTMENKKVFVDNSIYNSRTENNPDNAKTELSLRLMSDGEILKNIASFSNCDPNDDGFTKEGVASLKKILPLCQTFDKLYRGDGWKIEDVKKLKVGDSFRQPNKNDIDILNLSKSKSIAEEYAREGAKWSSDFVRITHTFENAQGFDNSYFSFFEDDEEVFIDKSEFILGSIEGDIKNGFNLIWYRKK